MIPSSVKTLFLVCLLGAAADTHGQPAGVADAAGAAPPRFTFGFEERYRGEWWNNLVDHDDAREDGRTQQRFRTRLWGEFALGPRASLVVGLATESRKVTRPDTDFTFDEFVFEQAVFSYRTESRWSARLGRQNIQRGEGFVLWDGTPLDGSRTAYFNAAVVSRAFRGATLDLIATYTPRTDEFLPRLHQAAVPKPISDWNEAGLGAYWSGRVRAGRWDGYVLSKRVTGDLRLPTASAFVADRTVTAFGTRAELAPRAGWQVNGEIVGEAGRQDAGTAGARSVRLGAWGGYARLRRQWSHRYKPAIEIGCTGLSGDEPTTPDIEGFDPMFARWPRESELLTNAMAIEYGPAYWTNQHAVQAAAQASPSAHLSLRTAYFHLGAYAPFHRRGPLFGDGLDRGDLWQARADWTAAPHWRGHVLYEHFAPGNFYASRDAGYFFRIETTYLFTKRW